MIRISLANERTIIEILVERNVEGRKEKKNKQQVTFRHEKNPQPRTRTNGKMWKWKMT